MSTAYGFLRSRRILELLAILVLPLSCASVNYIPTEPATHHPPTQKPAVFLQEQDVKRPYTVLGLIIVRSDSMEYESMMVKLLEKARAVGADAIILKVQADTPEVIPMLIGKTVVPMSANIHRLDATAVRFTGE